MPCERPLTQPYHHEPPQMAVWLSQVAINSTTKETFEVAGRHIIVVEDITDTGALGSCSLAETSSPPLRASAPLLTAAHGRGVCVGWQGLDRGAQLHRSSTDVGAASPCAPGRTLQRLVQHFVDKGAASVKVGTAAGGGRRRKWPLRAVVSGVDRGRRWGSRHVPLRPQRCEDSGPATLAAAMRRVRLTSCGLPTW